jgi:hypothetical protein
MPTLRGRSGERFTGWVERGGRRRTRRTAVRDRRHVRGSMLIHRPIRTRRECGNRTPDDPRGGMPLVIRPRTPRRISRTVVVGRVLPSIPSLPWRSEFSGGAGMVRLPASDHASQSIAQLRSPAWIKRRKRRRSARNAGRCAAARRLRFAASSAAGRDFLPGNRGAAGDGQRRAILAATGARRPQSARANSFDISRTCASSSHGPMGCGICRGSMKSERASQRMAISGMPGISRPGMVMVGAHENDSFFGSPWLQRLLARRRAAVAGDLQAAHVRRADLAAFDGAIGEGGQRREGGDGPALGVVAVAGDCRLWAVGCGL